MGALSELIDIIKDVPKIKTLTPEDAFKVTGKSLSQKASEGILQFPVIITNNMDIETAQNINKAIERNCATFVQVVFSMNPNLRFNDNSDPSAVNFITKFHKNMGVKDDYFNRIAQNITSESTVLFENDEFAIFSAIYEGATGSMVAENKKQLVDLLDHVNADILNNKYIPKQEVLYNFTDPKLNAKYNKVTEAKSPETPKTASMMTLNKNMLQDNDAKKANELIATTLHVEIKLINDANEVTGTIDFIVGIKAMMHIVKSQEMITNMVNACRNNNAVFNFIRWTTGETSFLKDFILHMDEIKSDVAKVGAGASPWWTALKHRRSLASIGNTSLFKKNIIPNASIVISAEEVEYIKTEYGFDLHNMIFVKKIMQTYFLLGFVIVDSSAQIAHFLFDGETDFQSVSFSALEKAGSTDERKFKEMLKSINRM